MATETASYADSTSCLFSFFTFIDSFLTHTKNTKCQNEKEFNFRN